MDKQTALYYKKNAEKIYNRYISVNGGVSDYFDEIFIKKSKIFDAGAGSGRDMLRLINSGHDAYGIEPCDELREKAVKNNPQLKSRLLSGKLPLDKNPFNHKFDAVICSAVLMHVPKEELFDSIFSIKNLLKSGGLFLLSLPDKRKNINQNMRDEHGRLFNEFSAGYIELLLKRTGFSLEKIWKNNDSMGRDGITWQTMLFKLTETEKINS